MSNPENKRSKIEQFIVWVVRVLTSRNTITFVLRIYVAALFAMAGVDKLRVPAINFADKVAAYDVLPLWLVHLWAMFLPAAEIVLSVALIAPFVWRVAATLTSGLSIVFLIAILQAILRGINLGNCGCGGFGGEGIEYAIVKNVSILTVLGIALFWSLKSSAHKRGWIFNFSVALGLFVLSGFTMFVVNFERKEILSVFSLYKTKETRLSEKVARMNFTAHQDESELKRAKKSGATGVISYDAVKQFSKNIPYGLVLVDARPDFFYEQGHLKGAINISFENFERDFINSRERLLAAERIIVFCRNNCDAAMLITKSLRGVGIKGRIDVAYNY